MRILFIKPKHIGDSLILTPTIVAAKKAYPGAEIWVVVRRGCEGILAGCPEIDHLLTISPVEKHERTRADFWRDCSVIVKLWAVRFDYVFELGDGHRARLLALLTRSKRHYSVKTVHPLKRIERWRFTAMSTFDWLACHRVEKDFNSVAEFLDLPRPIPPLRFDKNSLRVWEPGRNLSDFAVVKVGTRQQFKEWNRENWREVGHQLLDRHQNLVIACGPVRHEMELAAWLQHELGERALNTRGETSWPQIAELLYRAKIYVGLDTAAMHLAAACGCPIVTLFGPSIEDYWRPWQATYKIVTCRNFVPVGNTEQRFAQILQRSINDVRIDDVIAACDELQGRIPAVQRKL